MNSEEQDVVLSEPKRKTIRWDDKLLLTFLEQVYAIKPYTATVKKASAYEDVAYILICHILISRRLLAGYGVWLGYVYLLQQRKQLLLVPLDGLSLGI